MGCNCGGGANRQTIGGSRARQAAFKAAGSPLGFSADEPHVIGDADDRVRRVRVLRATDGLTAGQAAFVTGTGVDAHLQSGAFHDITKTQQRKRLFKVNGFTYTDPQEANRVAAALGVTPVEVA